MFHRRSYAKACQKALEGFSIPKDFGLDRWGNPARNAWSQEEIERLVELCKQGYRSFEIAPMLGRTSKAIQKTFRRLGMPSLVNICPRKGKDNPSWKGGIHIGKGGYIYLRRPEHPHANSHGYVFAHRLIVEEHLGRFLLPSEIVHHIDGNHSNNDISNLQVFSTNGEHLHHTTKGIQHNVSEDGRRILSEQMRNRWKAWKESGFRPRGVARSKASIHQT